MAVESLIIRAAQRLGVLSSKTREAQASASGLADAYKRAFEQASAAERTMARVAIANGYKGHTPFNVHLDRDGLQDVSAAQLARARDLAKLQLHAQAAPPPPPAAGSPAQAATGLQAWMNAQAGAAKRQMLATVGASSVLGWVMGGMPRAKEADIANDRLMRIVKGTTGGFDKLRERIADTASESKLSTEETAKLTESFARLGGRMDSNTALAETKAGVLSGRAMGLDDDAMPKWLAEMRFRGMGDAKALLPLVATTVARAGLGGRAEEVLDGLLDYTQRMERTTLTAPDLTKFTDLIAVFSNQQNMPGLRGAAGMEVAAGLDAAIKHPGGGEAGEMLMYGYYAANGTPDLYAQKKRRALGLAGLPGGLQGLLKYIEQYTGLKGDALDVAAGNALNMDPNAIEKLRQIDWSKGGGSEKGFYEWAKKKGVDASANPGAIPDLANLYAASMSGDKATIDGLKARYLTQDQLRKIGSGDGTEELIRSISIGKDKTRLDDTLERMSTLANAQEQIGRQALEMTNTLVNMAADVFKIAQDWLAASDKLLKAVDNFYDVTMEMGKRLGIIQDDGTIGGASQVWAGFKKGLGISAVDDWWSGVKAHRDSLGSAPAASVGAADVPDASKKYLPMVAETAKKYGLRPEFLAAVIDKESGWNKYAQSGAGAHGLMQLMPDTAARYGVTDRFNPGQSIDGGAQYLRFLLKKFGGDESKAATAYNAGEGKLMQAGGDIASPILAQESREFWSGAPTNPGVKQRIGKFSAWSNSNDYPDLIQPISPPAPAPGAPSPYRTDYPEWLNGWTSKNLVITLGTPLGDTLAQITQDLGGSNMTVQPQGLPASSMLFR